VINFSPGILSKSTTKLIISSNDPDQPEYTLSISHHPIKIESAYIVQWGLLFTAIVVLLIAILLYYRYRLKISLNQELESKVSEALLLQQQQKQIIIHQSRLTSLGEMAAGIAHEINVPLQNILFSIESIEMEDRKINADKPYVRKLVKEISDNVDKINGLIDHVTTFSGRQVSQVKSAYSVNEILESIISMTKVKLSKQKVKLHMDLQDDLPVVTGDPNKLEQVIINLLSNARDAVEERAGEGEVDYVKKIVVKSSLQTIVSSQQSAVGSQNPDKISLQKNQDNVLIEISDNGNGIPTENLDKIFNPFFTTKKLGKGTGLGLSISYGLIKEMNGTIDVISKLNQGTTFKITIPL
jgi:signal transduction histidine kinase